MRIAKLALLFYVASTCLSAQLSAQSSEHVVPDGRLLAFGQSCYTISVTKDGVKTPLGVTFQSITPGKVGDTETLSVIVHQHMLNGKFDMRDSLLLRRNDLRPIRLDSDRNGAPHVHLDYTEHRVSGWKIEDGTKKEIGVDLNGPVWDGNLWGVTFAAMPLRAGASFTLPAYQYDSGLGTFYIDVQGQSQIQMSSGPVQAWTIKAGLERSKQIDYTVSTYPGLELGYASGPMAQQIGGDCSGIQ